MYHAAPGDEIVVTLKGFSRSGVDVSTPPDFSDTRYQGLTKCCSHSTLQLSATITSLPQNGQLYQLSQVFSAYGYEPKRDMAPIAAVPAAVTGSKNRVVFARSILGGPPLHSKVRGSIGSDV